MAELHIFTNNTISDADDVTENFTELESRIDAFGGLFRQDDSTTAGLTWGYKAGRINTSSGPVVVAAGTKTLTPSATNYIEVDSTGTLSVSTSRTLTKKPIRKLITDGTGITTNTDERVDFDFTATSGINATSIGTGTVDNTEFGYLNGVTSAIQTQLDAKATDSAVVHKTGAESIAGVKTFSSSPIVPTPSGSTDAANKSYVDNAVAGLLDLKGNTDASANPNYPSASKGDAYYVTVAGKIGGASGKSVEIGDVYVASADNAGGTEASVGTSWFVLEHNLQGALLAANNLSDVANAATARTNLGAAAATHTHAASDITSGTMNTARLGSGTADNTKFLRGDQTWAVPSGGSVMTGATGGAAGTSGLVPQPQAGDNTKVLYGDGTWATPPGAGGGEANTASNLGSGTDGEGLYDSKTGVDLRFKRIKAGSGLSTTSEANDVLLAVNINGATAETTADNADEILIYDTSASANRKMTRANFLSGISGGGSSDPRDIWLF